MPTKPEEKPVKEPTEKPVVKTIQNTGENIATAGFAIAIASIFTNFFSFGVMALAGLVLSIIGRVQTKRAGRPSGIALAGIIISSVVMFFTLIAFVFFFMFVVIGGSRHQIDCDAPEYVRHDVCGAELFDDLSEPQQERRLKVDPDTL